MKAIQKTRLAELLKAMSEKAVVLAPLEVAGVTRFAPWQGQELDLDQNTQMSPKDALFPQTEKIYKFTFHGQDGEIIPEEPFSQKQVVFAARPCDVQGVAALDAAFLTKTYEDQYYKNRRDNTIFMSLGCVQPGPNCFCGSMGVNPQEAPLADVMMYDLGDEIGLTAQSEKGTQWLEQFNSLLIDTAKQKQPTGEFLLNIHTEGIVEKLKQMFDHPVWDDVSKKCLNCGACTYMCPTCHCFDISQKVRGNEGVKIKCWDSCMFNEYTLMAGGHNPRPEKKNRVRQRFMHKLRYFPERYGMFLCTGCGRCVAKCPVNLEITGVVNKVQEAELNVGS